MTEGSIQMFTQAGYLLVSGLLAVTVWIIVSPMFEGEKLKKRMESVSTARDTMRKNRMQALEAQASLRADTKGKARDVVDRFSLDKLLEAST